MDSYCPEKISVRGPAIPVIVGGFQLVARRQAGVPFARAYRMVQRFTTSYGTSYRSP
jgi:hypothetical protein